MNVTEAIRARRSIRKFTGAEIPQEHLDAILEAAMLGPSARKMRPYEFAVVKDRALLKELSEACPRWYMAEGAACVIIVFARPDLEEGLGHEFWQQDCSAATEISCCRHWSWATAPVGAAYIPLQSALPPSGGYSAQAKIPSPFRSYPWACPQNTPRRADITKNRVLNTIDKIYIEHKQQRARTA